jgi:hypothetical protein
VWKGRRGNGSARLIHNAMVKAIARAFRWREMLENGTHATIAEIAVAEKINASSSRSSWVEGSRPKCVAKSTSFSDAINPWIVASRLSPPL